jgi:hypothetical protein
VPRAPPPRLGRAHAPVHRADQDVGDRPPRDAGALPRAAGALRRGHPRAQGAHGGVGGRPRTHLGGHLTGRGAPTPTGRERRLLDLAAAADRRHDGPSTARLGSTRAQATGDTGAFGEGDTPPTRDAPRATWWGAVSRTDRLWAGVYPLRRDDVRCPVSPLPAGYPSARESREAMSSCGAQNQSAGRFW